MKEYETLIAGILYILQYCRTTNGNFCDSLASAPCAQAQPAQPWYAKLAIKYYVNCTMVQHETYHRCCRHQISADLWWESSNVAHTEPYRMK